MSTWSSVAVPTAPTLSPLTRSDTAISAPADPTESTSAAPSTATVVADGRSTPLSVAVDLGDETLRDDIVAMNRSPQWSNGVFPAGMLITVPVIETQIPPSDNLAPGWYVVQDNDGMWNVAQALLGDGTRHHELRELLIGQEVAPGVIFTADTSVIHPGWIFRTPAKVPADAMVLDPYMGSGTTGVAAVRSGRRFVGIEKDPTHYATALERVKNELSQLTLNL